MTMGGGLTKGGKLWMVRWLERKIVEDRDGGGDGDGDSDGDGDGDGGGRRLGVCDGGNGFEMG